MNAVTPAAAPVPVLLPNNQFDHFYRGGERIGALRGGPGGPRRPEEWVASTTTRAGQDLQGLSRLPDGSLLRDRVCADPLAWLGPEHLARYGGTDVELLVKLLDVGQRLPVHVHPDRAFARTHLGLTHGKTEAWFVVAADPGSVMGLGLRRPLEREEVAALVRARDSAALVDALHAREVVPGQGILVPAGTPHYIGPGVLVVEVQEPTDLSILLEWEGLAVDGDRDGHLELGYDLALQAVDLRVWDDADLRHRTVDPTPGPGLHSALPPVADPYFRTHVVRPAGSGVDVPAGFAVLVVLDGGGRLVAQEHGELALARGDIALLPWCAGGWRVEGDLTGVLCRPPAPDAPQAPR
jgi:mannose-6-phosphate isomerase